MRTGRSRATILAALALLAGVSHALAADPLVRASASIVSPTTSPYLNLLNGSRRSFALNYYRRVRPEQEFRAADAQLERDLSSLRRNVDERAGAKPAAGLPATGHAASFLQFGGYYSSDPRGALQSAR
jgi:hypothetical protein